MKTMQFRGSLYETNKIHSPRGTLDKGVISMPFDGFIDGIDLHRRTPI